METLKLHISKEVYRAMMIKPGQTVAPIGNSSARIVPPIVAMSGNLVSLTVEADDQADMQKFIDDICDKAEYRYVFNGEFGEFSPDYPEWTY